MPMMLAKIKRVRHRRGEGPTGREKEEGRALESCYLRSEFLGRDGLGGVAMPGIISDPPPPPFLSHTHRCRGFTRCGTLFSGRSRTRPKT